MAFHRIDIAIIAGYFLLILFLGFRRSGKPRADGDYLLMGRQLTLPGFLLSLVSSWYGGILGSSEYSYSYGFSYWIILGVPYYVFAAVFAVFLARRAREKYVFSIPHLISESTGGAGRMLSGILVLILATPAPYVLTIGVLLNWLFGIPLVAGVIGGALFSYLYVYRDGLAVIIRTDLYQCLFMYLGYGLLVAGAWLHWESPAALWSNLRATAPDHVSVTGGQPVSYVLVWFFMASWTLVSPMFHQRVYALRKARHARLGIVLAILLWLVFDSLTTLAGLYAFAHLPELGDPRVAHLALGEAVLPVGLQGLFIVGIFSVVMSTLDTELFVSGVSLGPDILGRTRAGSRFSEPVITRIGMALVMVTSIFLAIMVPSVVDLYYLIGTLAVPGLLLPVLAAVGIVPRIRAGLVRMHLWLVPSVSALWYLAGHYMESLPAIEPFYPGCLASALVWIAGALGGKAGASRTSSRG